MPDRIDHRQALEMFNATLTEMKEEISQAKTLQLKGDKQELLHNMNTIYDQFSTLVKHYEESGEPDLFYHTCCQMEILKPSFILNYQEILK